MAEGLIDEATVSVRGGDGGDGSASFHREKYRPKGGPDGGNGGHGGSVIVTADTSVETLAEFRVRRAHRARNGGPGGSRNRRGRDGDDAHVRVPVGTIVRDADSDEVLADLSRAGTSYTAARGGLGGRGNSSIASAVERAPSFAERGEPGEEHVVRLDLRLVADAGLLGPPNAGKSTLLRAVSAATPKVGDYPFTTLAPHLGVVETGGGRFVLADLPGLIEGASAGRGLGTRFLRHAQRCAVLCLVVDMAAPDPVGDLEQVTREVEAFSGDLRDRIRIVVANKCDLGTQDGSSVVAWAKERGLHCRVVSAMRGDGIGELVELLVAEVEQARRDRPPDQSFAVFRPAVEDPIAVEREGGGFRVRSTRVERLVAMTPLANPRAVRHLQRRLNALGVEAALARNGAHEGDEIYIGEQTFEYFPEKPA